MLSRGSLCFRMVVLGLPFDFPYAIFEFSFHLESHCAIMFVSFGSHVGSIWGSFWCILEVSKRIPFSASLFTRFGCLLGPKLSPSWPPSWAKLGSKTTFNFAQISSSFLKGFWSLLGSILGAFWAPKSTSKTNVR